MKKYKIVPIILSMVAAFFVLTGFQNKPKQDNNTINVTYTLKENNETVASKKVSVAKNAKVITGLKKCWKVKTAKDFVTSIDRKSENQKNGIYWTYTVNGKKVNKLANQQTLKNNDHVQFTLGKAD